MFQEDGNDMSEQTFEENICEEAVNLIQTTALFKTGRIRAIDVDKILSASIEMLQYWREKLKESTEFPKRRQ
jgi:hypothetical protein